MAKIQYKIKENINCRYYRGDMPCEPHKQTGTHCQDCKFYDPVSERILIIKLAAAGDVIRTTPLVRRLKTEMPQSFIIWVTDFPEFIPSEVDLELRINEQTSLWLKSISYDIVINLDKEPAAISLAESVRAKRKFGFGMDKYGHCRPFNNIAKHAFLTGLWDDVGRANTKSYQEEIFRICGYVFSGERYILQKNSAREWNLREPSPVVGLNTGAGSRWPSRLWPDDYWKRLAQELKRKGLGVVWLGGPGEHSKNERLANSAGGCYPGHFPFAEFIDLVNQCDVIVTQVTFALHIAIGLSKRIVLMNNIFNRNEFGLYDLGEIVEPPEYCGCFYASICPHGSMEKISPMSVKEAVLRQIDYIQLEK